jgi:hypothetical protein
MKEDNFSFVSYKHNTTLEDYFICERFTKHLKQMAERTSGKYVECRGGYERTHFKKAHKEHEKMLKQLKKKL